MTISVADLVTVAGNSAITYLLLQLVWRVTNPDPATKDRFGPLLAAFTGIVLALVGTAYLTFTGQPAPNVFDAIAVGFYAGLGSIGIHDIGDRVMDRVTGS
jgi:hypothetical protein